MFSPLVDQATGSRAFPILTSQYVVHQCITLRRQHCGNDGAPLSSYEVSAIFTP